LNPDEIAYIALALELALERQRTQKNKKNILLVCSSGAGTAKLLGFKLQEMFRDCIGNVYTCDEHSIKYQDFTNIDYIFTTVPIRTSVPVPISEMKLFWKGEDIAMIRGMLTSSSNHELMQYFPEELFFAGISFQTKKDVLQFMCNEMKRKGWVEDDFFEAVMKREEMGITCLDNCTAIPHPCQMMTERTFVSVGVLDEPVEWIEGQSVQVVFLISASKNKELDLQEFYLTVARLLLDKQLMKTLLEKRDYNTLQNLIKQKSLSIIN
jgi:lichenan operon transcriptional antiterminator